jgi:uncharacterized membrane protein
MLLFQQLQFVISSWFWLVVILLCFLGLLGWMTYMAIAQRKLLSRMLTREDLPEIFERWKKDLASGK